MKRFATIVTLFTAFTFTTAFGEAILPPIGASNNVRIYGPGYNLTGYAVNNPGGEHSHVHNEGQPDEWIHSWTEPKNAQGNFWGNIEQGVGDQFFVPYTSNLDVNYYDEGIYNVSWELDILFVDEEVDWTAPQHISASNDGVFGGTSYNAGFSVNHGSTSYWDEVLGEWIYTEDNSLQFDAYGNFEDSEVNNLWMNLSSWSTWYDETEYLGARISGGFSVIWDGATETLPSTGGGSLPVVSTTLVPEPASLALISIGALALLRRKNRR